METAAHRRVVCEGVRDSESDRAMEKANHMVNNKITDFTSEIRQAWTP
jgi:hypothetical protein